MANARNPTTALQLSRSYSDEEIILSGKYRLGQLLGTGSFGKVYLAENLKTGESVAIKAISKTKLTDKKKKASEKYDLGIRIKTEISIMRTLKHPNIVQLYEVMASKETIYFVMEYVNEGTLFDKIIIANFTNKPEPEHTSRRYFQQLISAVEFCHSRGIYHRDLKPDNLLLDDKGNLKVADFGLSATQEQVREDGLFHSACGTYCYLAPEVLRKRGYDAAKADVWSCGVVLYALRYGSVPFGDDDLSAIYNRMIYRNYSCPKPWFSDEVRELLSQMFDPNPNTRITIPEIMEVPWFKEGFEDSTRSLHHQDLNDSSCPEDVDLPFRDLESGLNPPYLNVFGLVASWGKGLDLAPLFGDSARRVLRFMSNQPVSAIISKFEEIGKANDFSVRERECKVNMKAMKFGRKGRLAVEAEIFEVAPSLYSVDVSKTGGDTPEYEKFRDEHLGPGLQDIVCAWHDMEADPPYVNPNNNNGIEENAA